MGWSCTQAAAESMNVIRRACYEQRQAAGEATSNVFVTGGKRYFYEETRRTLADGGISGRVFRYVDDYTSAPAADPSAVWCVPAGRFRIDGAGRLVRGPSFFRARLALSASAPAAGRPYRTPTVRPFYGR